MAVEIKYPGLAVVAAAMLLAACSARQQSVAGPVHASAAQRIDLGPAGAAPAIAPGAADAAASAFGAVRPEPQAAEEIRLPDGTVGIKVAQRYYHTVTACQQPDGTFATNCPRPGGHRP